MQSLKFFTIVLFLNSFSGFSQSDAIKKEIRINVDWLWGPDGSKGPAQISVWKYEVRIGDGSVKSRRGPLSGQACGQYGVLYGLMDKEDAAIQWFKAGQAHNADVVALFEKYPHYTIDYAKSKYKKNALASVGIGMATSDYANQIKDFFKTFYHNPPEEMPETKAKEQPIPGSSQGVESDRHDPPRSGDRK